MGWNTKFIREYIESWYLDDEEKFEHRYIGIILILITIALYELIYAYTDDLMIGSLGIFAVVTVMATFFGGVKIGIVCSAISLLYSNISFEYCFFQSSIIEKLLIMINALFLLTIVFGIGFIKQKVKMAIDDAKKQQESVKKSEEAILKSNKQLREIADNMFDVICMADGEGKLTYVSPSIKNILGYDPERIIEHNIIAGVHPDDYNNLEKAMRRLMDEGSLLFMEFQYKTAGGSYKWMEATGKGVTDEKGEITGIILSARDITTRKEAVLALKQNETKFREIFHNTNDAILLHRFLENGVPGRFTEANNKAEEMLGYSKEELMHMNSIDITSEDEIESLQLRILDFMIEERITYESKLIRKDKTIIPVEVSGHLFVLDGETVLVSIIRDITERKQAEEDLRQSEEKYRNLVEISPDAIYVHKNGEMYYANKAAVKLFGMEKAEDIIGRNMMEFLQVTKEFEAINLYRKEQWEKGATELPRWCYKLERYDGEIVDVEGVSIPTTIDGKAGTQFVVRDISERKRIEEMRQKAEREMELYKEIVEYDRLKTEFFANVSHEIRTPLNLILSALQLMNMNIRNKTAIDDKEKLSRYTGIMKQNCYRLLRLVNNLIDVTKLDSGYIQVNLKNENIISLVEDIVLSVVEYVENKSLKLSFDTNIEEMIIACDAEKLERIILNLLSNAIKFTRPGDSIYVIIDAKEDSVKIHVKDTGIGIPEDKKELVFERFRQVDRLLTRTREGSGIGLSLVKGLVEMQGGTISLNSSYGEGSEFIIELPANHIEDDAYAESEIAACEAQERIERINIEFSDIYE